MSTEPAPASVLRASLLRSEHTGAVLRILFGLIWAADATFKWLPGFIHGQTLPDELGKAPEVQTPVIHQWLDLWHSIGTKNPGAFAVTIAVIETLIAVGLIFGAFSNITFIASAILSFGIWSGAEAFHLPWSKPGITDLGPSVAYIIASLALFTLAAGSRWSVDDAFLRRKVGKHTWTTSPEPRSDFVSV